MLLSEAFHTEFPNVQYSAYGRLLAIPLVSLRIGSPESGKSKIYLCEYNTNVNYHHFIRLLSTHKQTDPSSTTKSKLRHFNYGSE